MTVLRNIFYFLNNIRIKIFKKKVWVSITCKIKPRTIFKGYNKISGKTFFKGEIGKYSYIGPRSVIDAKIGNYCSIGPNVQIITGNHPLSYVSTSPFFFSSKAHLGIRNERQLNYNSLSCVEYGGKKYGCIIGNDVWIGSNVIIKGGCKIGDGAVIGMGSVVTKDIPPYAVVGGNPAKIIKFRFPDEIVENLEKVRWWNYSYNEINKYIEYMDDANTFLSKIVENEESKYDKKNN